MLDFFRQATNATKRIRVKCDLCELPKEDATDLIVEDKRQKVCKACSGLISTAQSIVKTATIATIKNDPEKLYIYDKFTGTIAKYLGREATVTLPTKLGGVKMTKVGVGAFKQNTALTGLTIPNGYTLIDISAFESCTGLTQVLGNTGLVTIASKAFRSCTALTSVTFLAGLVTVGADAFAECRALPYVTLPSAVTTVGAGAFYNCALLAYAKFNGNVPTSWGTNIFYGCKSEFVIQYPTGKTGYNLLGYPITAV